MQAGSGKRRIRALLPFDLGIMTHRRASFILSIVFLSACAPQAELVKTRTDLNEVRTEIKAVRADLRDIKGIKKRLDKIDANVKGTTDLQGVVADHGVRFDQLTTDLQILQGKLEENNYKIAELSQKLDDKTYKISELAAKVEELETKVKSLSGGASRAGGEKKTKTKLLDPSEAYSQAKADYDRGNFDLAIAGFRNYLKQFPDTSQADAAQYWIAECYYSKKDYPAAVGEFFKVLKRYPKSDKAPGARLKIGFSYLNEKNTAKAKVHFNRVLKDYPHSREAKLAKEKLSKIRK